MKRLSQLFTGGVPLPSSLSSSSLAGVDGATPGEGAGGVAGGAGGAASSSTSPKASKSKRRSILGGFRRSSKSKGSSLPCHGYFQGMVPLILDHGSGMIKAGFAADSTPRYLAPSIIGVPRLSSVRVTTGANVTLKECYIGQAALAKRGLLALSFPIKNGVVQNWDHLQKMWTSMYHDFEVDARDHPVLVTQPPLNPRANREKLVEIFLETFRAPAVSVVTPSLMALYGSGRSTGVVLDIGDGVAHSMAVYQNTPLTHTICRTDLAGRDVTEYLISLVMENGGYAFTSSSEKDIARQIKEKFGYVAERYESEVQFYKSSASKNVCYTLPDGQTVLLGEERFRCAEPLFRPPLLGKEHGGVHQLLLNSIAKSDPDLWKELYQNIVLSGGTTMLPGFEQRLQHELGLIAPVGTKMRFISQNDRTTSAWMGAKYWLQSAPAQETQSIWLSAKEFEEYGMSAVHRSHLML